MAFYCFDSGPIGRVKLGFASNVATRFSGCQVGSPVELTLAAVDPRGDRLTEAEVQWRFRAFRSRGDWFDKAPEVAEFVAEVARTNTVPGAWYAPLVDDYFRVVCGDALTLKEVMAKFRLAFADIRVVWDTINITKPTSNQPITVGLIPPLVDHLRRRGVECGPWNFYPAPADHQKRERAQRADEAHECARRVREQKVVQAKQRVTEGFLTENYFAEMRGRLRERGRQDILDQYRRTREAVRQAPAEHAPHLAAPVA